MVVYVCVAINMVVYIVMYVVLNMAVYKLCKKLNFITIYNAYILKVKQHDICCVFYRK